MALALGAVWLRTRYLGYSEIWEDQALTLNMALEWVHGGSWPLASMKSSFGVFNPPLIEYLYALPLFLKPDLLGVNWFVALANLAGLFVAGAATQRVFGWRVAGWATLLFAVNPWADYYGRLIWMQSFVPCFASLFYACLLLYFAEAPRTRYLLGAALSLSATIQVHLTAVVLLLVLLLTAAACAQRVRWRPLLAGSALFALTWLPFFIFELRNGLVDLAALRTGLGQPAEVNWAPVLILFDLLQGQGLAVGLLPAPDTGALGGLLGLPFQPYIVPLFVLAVMAAALTALAGWRANHWRRAQPGSLAGRTILLIWLVVPLLIFVRHNQYLQNYYFLYLFPVPFVLLALFAEQTAGWVRRGLATRGWALHRPAARCLVALAFVPLGLVGMAQARQAVLAQNQAAAGRVGRQRVIEVRQAIETSRALLAERPDCQFVVVSNGAQYEASRFALMREFVHPSKTRFLAAGADYLLPAPCALYFVAAEQAEAPSWLQAMAVPLPQATIRTPTQRWTFYDLPAPARALAVNGLSERPPLGEWENGLQLRDVSVEGSLQAGASLMVRASWGVTQARPAEALHFGTYLLNAERTLVTQADGPGVDSAAWTVGDVFGTNFTLSLPADLPPGRYSIATALYSYPDIQRLALMEGDGDLLILQDLVLTAQ